MLGDCSILRDSLSGLTALCGEWNDEKSDELERECLTPIRNGIDGLEDKLYEISSFISEVEEYLDRRRYE